MNAEPMDGLKNMKRNWQCLHDPKTFLHPFTLYIVPQQFSLESQIPAIYFSNWQLWNPCDTRIKSPYISITVELKIMARNL